MTISKIDIGTLIIFAIFAIRGYKKGAIDSLVNLVGLIASFIIAWLLATTVTDMILGIPVVQTAIIGLIGKTGAAQAVVMSVVNKTVKAFVFVLLFILLMVVVKKVKQWLKIVDKIPIVGWLNKVIGLGIGILTAGLILSALLGFVYLIAQVIGNGNLQSFLLESTLLSLALRVIN